MNLSLCVYIFVIKQCIVKETNFHYKKGSVLSWCVLYWNKIAIGELKCTLKSYIEIQGGYKDIYIHLVEI